MTRSATRESSSVSKWSGATPFGDAIGDLAARTFVGALFVLLSINLLNDFLRTGRVTGLLFLVSEALVVVLTIVRRRARVVDRSMSSAILTAFSLIGPPLMRAGAGPALAPDLVTALVSTIGVAIVIAGKVTIGRSFGIAPANRGVVARGPYNIVRHPIYAGYLLTHAATLAAYPSWWNVFSVIAGDIALVLRALAEERVLSSDREYQRYCNRVAWHLVPGVY
jgi:protein-S-isoprenylcysteine O-methyltransferase Ste14